MKVVKLLLAGLGLLLVPAALGGTWVMLDRHISYRSPFYSPEPPPTPPRAQALEDLDAWRAQQAVEEAKLAALREGLTTEKMIELGKEIVHGRGLCFNCHSLGTEGGGIQGPNLEGVGARAGSRIPGLTAEQYFTQSLYRPAAFVVPGFNPVMTPANEPPIGLDDNEIKWVIAYLESLGGEVTMTPDTQLPDPDKLPTQ